MLVSKMWVSLIDWHWHWQRRVVSTTFYSQCIVSDLKIWPATQVGINCVATRSQRGEPRKDPVNRWAPERTRERARVIQTDSERARMCESEPEGEPDWEQIVVVQILACITINSKIEAILVQNIKIWYFLPPKCRLQNCVASRPPSLSRPAAIYISSHTTNNGNCTNIQQTRHNMVFTKLDWIVLLTMTESKTDYHEIKNLPP